MPDGLSIIVPVVDRAEVLCERLPPVRDALAGIFSSVELVVVDDGQRGAADAVRRGLPGARVLCNRRNLGKGASVLLGLAAARSRHALYTDSDFPFDVESYARLGRALADGNPFVIGCRRRSESQILLRFDSLRYVAYRHIVGLAFNRAVKLSTGLPWADTQCGLKGFERKLGLALFESVHDPAFLFDLELLLAARARGVEAHEVPVCVIYEDARSTVKLGNDLVRVGRGLLEIAWRQRRRGYAAPAAASLLERVQVQSEEISASSPRAGS